MNRIPPNRSAYAGISPPWRPLPKPVKENPPPRVFRLTPDDFSIRFSAPKTGESVVIQVGPHFYELHCNSTSYHITDLHNGLAQELILDWENLKYFGCISIVKTNGSLVVEVQTDDKDELLETIGENGEVAEEEAFVFSFAGEEYEAVKDRFFSSESFPSSFLAEEPLAEETRRVGAEAWPAGLTRRFSAKEAGPSDVKPPCEGVTSCEVAEGQTVKVTVDHGEITLDILNGKLWLSSDRGVVLSSEEAARCKVCCGRRGFEVRFSEGGTVLLKESAETQEQRIGLNKPALTFLLGDESEKKIMFSRGEAGLIIDLAEDHRPVVDEAAFSRPEAIAQSDPEESFADLEL